MKKDLKPVDFVYEINKPIFGFVEGNRPLNMEHVREIKRAMKLGAFVPPIIIDSATDEIVDGQHRYQAACELWSEGIEYTILAIYHNYGNTLDAAIVYNNKSRGWKTVDYVRAYIAQGNTSYILLQRFCETHELLMCKTGCQYRAASEIITGNGKNLVNGLLKINEELLVQAEIIYRELALMVKATKCGFIVKRGNVLAWMEARTIILQSMSFEEYLDKLSKYFSVPFSDKKADWVNEYVRIALK